MTHLPHVRQGRTRDLSQERLAGPDQARGWDDFGCNHTKSTSRLVTQLTSRSSRARFAVSDRTGPQRAGRLNSGVRSCQCKFSREKRLSLASRSCSAPLRSRFTHNSPPSARITRGAPDFIRLRPSRFSCCHAVLRGSHAGARGNKPCRVYLRASVRFDGVKAGSQQKRPAGHDLTIRSSRVRFAASSRCGKLVHLAVAAPLPGLAQALDVVENFKLLETQFNITHDCLRSFIFAGHIASIKDKADAWHSIADMCFADGVIGWNMIFGTKSQPTHWQKFNEMVPPGLSEFLCVRRFLDLSLSAARG